MAVRCRRSTALPDALARRRRAAQCPHLLRSPRRPPRGALADALMERDCVRAVRGWRHRDPGRGGVLSRAWHRPRRVDPVAPAVLPACLDWSERRSHLAGALGGALATRCFELRLDRAHPRHPRGAGHAGRPTRLADDILDWSCPPEPCTWHRFVADPPTVERRGRARRCACSRHCPQEDLRKVGPAARAIGPRAMTGVARGEQARPVLALAWRDGDRSGSELHTSGRDPFGPLAGPSPRTGRACSPSRRRRHSPRPRSPGPPARPCADPLRQCREHAHRRPPLRSTVGEDRATNPMPSARLRRATPIQMSRRARVGLPA